VWGGFFLVLRCEVSEFFCASDVFLRVVFIFREPFPYWRLWPAAALKVMIFHPLGNFSVRWRGNNLLLFSLCFLLDVCVDFARCGVRTDTLLLGSRLLRWLLLLLETVLGSFFVGRGICSLSIPPTVVLF